MRAHRRAAAISAGLVAALTLAAGAAGYAVARAVDVPRGRSATFLPSHWNCRNLGSRVVCQLGDAFPYVTLTRTRRGGVTVRVHTLRDPQAGHMTRSYVRGYPVYVFTAL